MVELIFPDGSKQEVEKGTPFGDLLRELPGALRKKAVAVSVDDQAYDLNRVVEGGGRFVVLTTDSDKGLDILRHGTSHLMALAVQELFGKVKFAIGPAIQDGFYYDILMDHTLSPDDLEKIEAKMRELLDRGDLAFTREVLPSSEAVKLFTELDQPFKVELINDLGAENVSIYRLGAFTDLCVGPHLADVRKMRHFKLLSLAGAYWRGDENRDMLQRIYGTVFFKEAELRQDLERREEARKRDHRKLGPQLELFDIKEEAGGGLVFWYPKGYILREMVENFWIEEHRKDGYQMILTPHIAKSGLWKTSGHYDYYKENMFLIRDDEDQEFVLKPMNCPGHILIYKNKLHSYRDLPIRYAELGTVYRNERSGTLHGLLRVRGFTQDDAHIFCTPEQMEEEVSRCFNLAHKLLTTFGFKDYQVELSAHDPQNMEKYAGSEEDWIMAEEALLKTIENRNIPFKKIPGEAVFYGPKIDLKLIDAIGRGWQATTIQFDFNLPRRFDVTYINKEGQKEYVYMIHRALLGSIERFIGTLTEHYAGAFPLWLSPEQVRVLPVGKEHHGYARECVGKMRAAGIRAEGDFREEKLGYKIRESELQKVYYMAVCGDKETQAGTLDIRSKSKGRLGVKKLDLFIEEVVDEIGKKT